MPDPVNAPAATGNTADTSANIPQENPAPIENPDGAAVDVEPWRKVKHKFKAMGQEHEVEYDDLVKRAEKATGAEKRLAEASRMEKEAKERLEKLKTVETFDDVVELFGGGDRARVLAERFVYDKMMAEEEENKLTPDQRQLRDEKKRADTAEKKAKDLEQATRDRDKEAQRDASASIINQEVSVAIAEAEKAGLSPEDVPKFLEDLFENMILHLEYLDDCEQAGTPATQSPLSPADVLRKLQDKHSDRSKGWLQKLSAKDLRGLLSEDQLDGLRKSDVEAILAPSTQNRASKPNISKKPDDPVNPFHDPKAPKKSPNTNDWFAAMENRYRRR